MAEKKGLLVKDEQGNMYYLRPEILEATKMPKADVKKTEDRIKTECEGDTSGFALTSLSGTSLKTSSSLSVSGTYLSGSSLNTSLVSGTSLTGGKLDIGNLAASTSMCPW